MSQKLSGGTTKPRVLISGHLPPPMGGVAMYYQSLLNSSLPERVDLCFVQTSSQKRAWSQSGRLTLSNLALAVRDCERFARAVAVHRPQIAHIATAFGLSFLKHSLCVGLARLSGSRVLLHPHCSLSVLYTQRPQWWRWLFRQVIRLTDGIIALSTEWSQIRAMVPSCPVFYLPNAVDLAAYRDIAQAHIAQVRSDRPVRVLYLGYLGQAKGSFDLIDAAGELLSCGPALRFDLVGDELTPGEKAQLRARIDAAGLSEHLRLHPATFGPAKLAFFRQADIFVYPSYHEGMPMAVLEAMACGLPIVATRTGGLPDLVIDGVNGLLVEPARPDQLAAALHKLSSNHELRFCMRQQSYRFAAERYDLEQHVTQLVELYQATLSGHGLTLAQPGYLEQVEFEQNS